MKTETEKQLEELEQLTGTPQNTLEKEILPDETMVEHTEKENLKNYFPNSNSSEQKGANST